ncbi:MAG: permease-like cell division protein FtsX [Saprospiraceae bacterium]|nr:permease-like cell division protein FtsX [Saprospiraceae bacterium]
MKKRKINYFYSIVSVALVLLLLGFFGTALLFTRQQVDNQQEKISMMLELKENPDELALDMLKNWLPKADFVREVRFVSKEQAATMMRKSLGDEYISADMPLPFYDAYSINLKTGYLNADSIAAVSAHLRTNEAINDVYMDEGLMGDVAKTVEKIALIAFIIAALFIIVAITLIHNTIRLNLFSDRFIIKNMELVGASWGFISRPYISRGIRNGFLSALLALVLLGILWFFAQIYTPELNLLLTNPLFWLSSIGLILLGVLISWVSTFYVVNKYLKMRLDDLY